MASILMSVSLVALLSTLMRSTSLRTSVLIDGSKFSTAVISIDASSESLTSIFMRLGQKNINDVLSPRTSIPLKALDARISVACFSLPFLISRIASVAKTIEKTTIDGTRYLMLVWSASPVRLAQKCRETAQHTAHQLKYSTQQKLETFHFIPIALLQGFGEAEFQRPDR